MKLLKLFFLLMFSVTLMACSKSDDSNTEHFASSQQRALEKAKNVDNLLQDAEEKRRKQMEEMEN